VTYLPASRVAESVPSTGNGLALGEDLLASPAAGGCEASWLALGAEPLAAAGGCEASWLTLGAEPLAAAGGCDASWLALRGEWLASHPTTRRPATMMLVVLEGRIMSAAPPT